MVGPGDRADDAGAVGPVLAGELGGAAVSRGGPALGRADGVVCQGGADVLGLPTDGPEPDLAGAAQRHVGGQSRRDRISSMLLRGDHSGPLSRSLMAKVECASPARSSSRSRRFSY